ncbi:ubiquitin-protein ligase-like protein [Plenodomus tracheiphilus IPT5]|uniref:Ubiquitin-protein ligase-like protein n=1 Tax=Plenodomus tracheiphilus IPT5 TaxID=1408161 RepID=A0A6A7BL11_9PLEO|nr:ubiquitin-protein ligase-like protein [Plenodomus tracheiphilus IPT5]
MEASGALANVTSYFPSPADLLMALPRLFSKASSLGDMLRSGGSAIAEPTLVNATNSTITMTAGRFVQESVAAAVSTASGSGEEISMFQAVKNVASFFSYITSKWAIATFAIAVLLNRTHFYASSRVPLSFDRLYLRFTLYIVPLLLFLYQIQGILQAIRCQTSPGWSEMQYGGPGRQLDTDFGGEGGYMWRGSSALLFWQTTEESCRAANMLPLSSESTRPAGSLRLLWPLFLSLGFGQFVETLTCALQGRHPIQEVGMTIFEHSLAFAEAEAVVTKPLAMDMARFLKPKNVFAPDGTSLLIPRSGLSRIANAPPEVLIISLISSISHLTSNVLAIAGVRSRYRLITTAIWGIAYMSTFAWSFARLASAITDPDQYLGILRFPTVCIVGFIPHLLILTGILLCGCIYALALVITVLSPPPGQPASLTLKERFAVAYGNLHANIHLSAITPLTINWNEDFYTAILKVGFTVLTAASEAVFLNEGTKVNVHSMTWLEKQRLQGILARRRRFRENIINVPPELMNETLAQGVEVTDKFNGDARNSTSTSGYARERKTRGINPTSDPARRNDPTGLGQRRSRFFLVYHFWRSIVKLIALAHARLIIWSLRRVRVNYLPRWLRRVAGGPGLGNPSPAELYASSSRTSIATSPWLTLDNRNRVRQDDNFNIEDFATERLRKSGYYTDTDTKESSDRLDDYLYSWWRNGGRWNDLDTTADYIPPQDDDTTSVLSFASTSASNSEWSDVDNSDNDDGQRTPTRDTYQRSRSTTPMPNDTLDFTRLSQLLDPKTKDDREEAKLLSRHLQSNTIMTRSRYRAALEKDDARILTTSRYKIDAASVSMTPEEEEQLLEDLILSKRSVNPANAATTGSSWDTGAEGMGSEGPQCVVCQMAPRTVLVWPCGCLSLCDECRVGLASKNYTACVCCRTGVVAYSRLYVP